MEPGRAGVPRTRQAEQQWETARAGEGKEEGYRAASRAPWQGGQLGFAWPPGAQLAGQSPPPSSHQHGVLQMSWGGWTSSSLCPALPLCPWCPSGSEEQEWTPKISTPPSR